MDTFILAFVVFWCSISLGRIANALEKIAEQLADRGAPNERS